MSIQASCVIETVVVIDVQFVPNLVTNMLSRSQVSKNGHDVHFNVKDCKMSDNQNDLIVTKL